MTHRGPNWTSKMCLDGTHEECPIEDGNDEVCDCECHDPDADHGVDGPPGTA